MRSGIAVRLAVDIGGTFTDVVLEAGSGRTISKVLTTSSQPEIGFLEGVHLALKKAGIPAVEVDLIVHGTTLATNALIERKGAKVGLVCTRGFRDTLEMAYEHRFEQSDVFMHRPTPLVPRWLRLEVTERMASTGGVLIEMQDGDGAMGSLRLKSGLKLRSKGRQTVPAGDVLVLEMPGGGGYGPPAERDPGAIRADLRAGFVSEEAARTGYGFKG